MNTRQIFFKISNPQTGVVLGLLQRHEAIEANISIGLESIHDARYSQIENSIDAKLESYYDEHQLLLMAQYWLSCPDEHDKRDSLKNKVIEEYGFPDSEFFYHSATVVERVAIGGAYACAEIERLKR